MSVFDEWFKASYLLEERMTNPALRADAYVIWSGAINEALYAIGESSSCCCYSMVDQLLD